MSLRAGSIAIVSAALALASACSSGEGETGGTGGSTATGPGGATASTSTSGTAAGGAGPTSTTSANTSTTSGTGGGACATDACPMASGLEHDCEQRFALGVNYAWHNFGTDFGGLAMWNQQGVASDAATYDAELATMKQNGVSVVRWWVFPDFRGDGITWNASGDPTGITAAAVADVHEALALAAKHDLYLVFTIFSFDAFRPDQTNSGVLIRSIAPIVVNATRRANLMNSVVRPLAKAAASSPDASHLLGWDVVNEPEWAVTPVGSAPGGQDFTPNNQLTLVTLAQMKSLIDDGLAVLSTETPTALKSVGWAAAKWAWAFSDVTGLDFNQPHIYGWVDEYWPYTKTPAQIGYATKPTVMGEFTLSAMPFSDGNDNATYAQVLSSWWSNGYAGAWAWAFNGAAPTDLALVKTFASSKGCPAAF